MEARYAERVKSCKSEEELCEYLLDTVSLLREYLDEDAADPAIETKNIVGLKIKSKTGVRRQDIYKRYMSDVEGINDELFFKTNNPDVAPCRNCNSTHSFIIDEVVSDRVCKECGFSEMYQSSDVGYKEEQDMEKTVIYSYKRENHFNEWVSQFQAKESTNVPDEVISLLRNEFKKQKIKDLCEITHEKVKTLLKKLDKSKYYEHVPYITTMINGIRPPTMPMALEAKLRLMFHKIQKPFEKHKPEKRKNFLSYSYVLYKFCELLGEDDYLPCFPLLKSKEKLYAQDEIWKKICTELEWEYIKTV